MLPQRLLQCAITGNPRRSVLLGAHCHLRFSLQMLFPPLMLENGNSCVIPSATPIATIPVVSFGTLNAMKRLRCVSPAPPDSVCAGLRPQGHDPKPSATLGLRQACPFGSLLARRLFSAGSRSPPVLCAFVRHVSFALPPTGLCHCSQRVSTASCLKRSGIHLWCQMPSAALSSPPDSPGTP